MPKDLTKSLLFDHGFNIGVTAKNKNQQAQSWIPKRIKANDVYEGKEVLAPLYQVELREINAMNNRYNASKVQELTMRQEMDQLAERSKQAKIKRYW